MKVTYLEFTAVEATILRARAVMNMVAEGKSKEEAVQLLTTLTPQNIVRLALGFQTRKRGGARVGTGPKTSKKKPAKTGKSAGKSIH